MGINIPGVAGALTRLLTGKAADVAAKVAKLGAVLLLVGSVAHCAGLTPKDKLDLASYSAQQTACVVANPKNKAAIDACRAAVRAKWCAQWAAQFDAAVCAPAVVHVAVAPVAVSAPVEASPVAAFVDDRNVHGLSDFTSLPFGGLNDSTCFLQHDHECPCRRKRMQSLFQMKSE